MNVALMSQVKAEILELENRRYQAMLDRDVELLAQLCSDDLIYTHSNATRDTKGSYLAKVEAGFFVYKKIDHPVETVIVRKDSAVVTGQMRAQVVNDGVEKTLDNACVAVWAKDEDGTWRFVAYQPTPNAAV
jgi:ketosteroid isomerase-like protein